MYKQYVLLTIKAVCDILYVSQLKHIHNVQLNWWCHTLQATDIITNVHKQILAHNAAFIVFVVVMVYMVVILLWLLMGSCVPEVKIKAECMAG